MVDGLQILIQNRIMKILGIILSELEGVQQKRWCR
jgi:hypothetical protein